MTERRLRDAAFMLPIVGILLLVPPWIRILDQEARVFGVPVLLVGLFGLWAIGIALTAALATRLSRLGTDDQRAPPDRGDG